MIMLSVADLQKIELFYISLYHEMQFKYEKGPDCNVVVLTHVYYGP